MEVNYKLRSGLQILLVVAYVILLPFETSARADTAVGTALSVEWLVDSSDEIIQIQLDEGTDDDPLIVRTQVALKNRLSIEDWQSKIDTSTDPLFRFRVYEQRGVATTGMRIQMGRGKSQWWGGGRVLPGDQWLLFVRLNAEDVPSICYSMNLTRTREQSSTAAIMASGKVLLDKASVLAAVTARIRLDRQLPKGTQRELIDRWDGYRGIVPWVREKSRRGGFWSAADIDPLRGGFAIRADIDYWDTTRDGIPSEGLIIMGVIVPADQESYVKLLHDLKQDRPPEHSIYALLNFPGEQTEKFLEELIGENRYYSSARRVLTHLQYCDDFSDPLNKKLIGSWHLLGRTERVELELRDDQTCSISTFPHDSRGSGSRPTTGKGYWSVKDGKFWVARSHVIIRDESRPALRWFFPAKKILSYSEDLVKLENGLKMIKPEE